MTDQVTTAESPAPAESAATPGAPLPGVPAAQAGGAPETPATPPASAPEADAEPDLKAAGFESTEDPALNLALKFVASRGITATDPAIQAARNGDFSLLRAKLSTMGDKAAGWQEHLALAEGAYERAQKQAASRNEETAAAVYSAVGGKEQWEAIAAWAAGVATPAEKEQINAAFAAGGMQAKAAAAYLKATFQAAGQVIEQTPKAAAKDTAGATPPASNALTAKQYSDAVSALSAKHGGRDVSGLPEYRALQQARLAGRRRGL